MKHEKSASHHCNICNGKFPSAIKFRDHMKKVHTKVTCEICEQNFTRIQLKKHKATEHGIGSIQPEIPINPYKCPFCPMSFKSKKGLQKHSEVKHDTEIEVEMDFRRGGRSKPDFLKSANSFGLCTFFGWFFCTYAF